MSKVLLENVIALLSLFSLAGVELNKPTYFTVNTKAAGKAKLDVKFTGPTQAEAVRDFDIINNNDGTHTVKYTPVQQVGGMIWNTQTGVTHDLNL